MSTGRVGGVGAEEENPFAALINPGIISNQKHPSFSFTTGIEGVRYNTLKQVLVYSPQTKTYQRQDYNLSDLQNTTWALGFTYPFLLPTLFSRAMGFGITLSGPYQKLRSFSAYAPEDFFAMRYGNSDSQFKGTLSLSTELWPEHLYYGVGLSLFISGAGVADASLATNNPSGRLAMDVGMNTSLVTGFYWKYEKAAAGLTYHQEINPIIIEKLEGSAPVAGSTVYLPVIVKSSLYYEPHALEFDFQRNFEGFKTSVGISYQFWKLYQSPILMTESIDADGNKTSTELPQTRFKNTINPRASVSVPFFEEKLQTSIGYQYRPSPVGDLSGLGNILDTETHIIGLSLEHKLAANTLLTTPMKWGIFGQYHFFNDRKIEKKTEVAGSPYYVFGGHAYTYGVSLEVEL